MLTHLTNIYQLLSVITDGLNALLPQRALATSIIMGLKPNRLGEFLIPLAKADGKRIIFIIKRATNIVVQQPLAVDSVAELFKNVIPTEEADQKVIMSSQPRLPKSCLLMPERLRAGRYGGQAFP